MPNVTEDQRTGPKLKGPELRAQLSAAVNQCCDAQCSAAVDYAEEAANWWSKGSPVDFVSLYLVMDAVLFDA